MCLTVRYSTSSEMRVKTVSFHLQARLCKKSQLIEESRCIFGSPPETDKVVSDTTEVRRIGGKILNRERKEIRNATTLYNHSSFLS